MSSIHICRFAQSPIWTDDQLLGADFTVLESFEALGDRLKTPGDELEWIGLFQISEVGIKVGIPKTQLREHGCAQGGHCQMVITTVPPGERIS
ncbi:unnamed protein product [Somion occarium]|uniref:Uncharacterized protein n=1 Tax=Somion occarium TaxID=3059160 RepID=A0ABP1ECT2_9APHY